MNESTHEILKRLAPEFVGLDEAEILATEGDWKATKYEIVTTKERNGEALIAAEDYRFRIVADFDMYSIPAPGDKYFIVESRNQTRPLLDSYAQALVRVEKARETLKLADQFISNGVELGYIQMPDDDCPDSAHQTPLTVRTLLKEIGE